MPHFSLFCPSSGKEEQNLSTYVAVKQENKSKSKKKNQSHQEGPGDGAAPVYAPVRKGRLSRGKKRSAQGGQKDPNLPTDAPAEEEEGSKSKRDLPASQPGRGFSLYASLRKPKKPKENAANVSAQEAPGLEETPGGSVEAKNNLDHKGSLMRKVHRVPSYRHTLCLIPALLLIFVLIIIIIVIMRYCGNPQDSGSSGGGSGGRAVTMSREDSERNCTSGGSTLAQVPTGKGTLQVLAPY
ncbi:uncharacterized protein LOC116412612 [Xenopus tropicalis]|uniref:Uncharacterized protein LOC116412612 n=1 Tax=Xenopus tropicalis TaxID=8364 RepID=A0A8J1K207_XENTR|nr:uncharacterized protein LOC116412612 [Xenopus tropicalis]